jgi:hypothetical protein
MMSAQAFMHDVPTPGNPFAPNFRFPSSANRSKSNQESQSFPFRHEVSVPQGVNSFILLPPYYISYSISVHFPIVW